MKLKLEQKGARIELIPLIDIIFLLLVFFIYSMLSMVVYRGIPVKLPVAEAVETEKGEVLVITINKRGKVFLDKESVSRRRLLSELKAARAAFPAKGVIISGHGEAHYKVFVDVLDKVRLAGFEKVSMEARLRKGVGAFADSE
ncbi:MAG: biopolymer transporter ExbD [Deltaproteobacteria bacterium]|nr:biopolymer transporter ExbD [Deltaproteobacteria bacterium]